MARLTLADVDADVLVDVFQQLSVRDLLRVRQTCRYLYDLTHAKLIWVNILHQDVISARIPIPEYCRPVQDLAGTQVEALVTHALRLESDMLQPSQQRTLQVVPLHQARSVTWVKLVQAKWLIVASSNASTSVLSIWSLASLLKLGSSREPLSHTYLSGPVREGILDVSEDRDRNERVILSLDICSPQPSIQILQLCGDDCGVPRFSCLATLTDGSHLRSLRGPIVGFALHREFSVPCVWNWESGIVTRLCDQPNPSGGCVAMDTWDNLVAVITPEQLQLFVTQDNLQAPIARKILLQLRGEVSFADVVIHRRLLSRDNDDLSSSEPTIHFCICDHLGLHVLQVTDLSREFQDFNHVRRWSSPLPLLSNPEYMPYEIAPRLGPGCTSVSWIDAFEVGKGEFRIMNGMLPLVDGPAPLRRTLTDEPYLRLVGPSMPALYFHAVRDFDEGLGLLVAGSAFGELVLCQFDGLSLRKLDGCFEETQLPPVSYDMLSDVRPQSIPAPPFPYGGPRRQPDDAAQRLLAHCKAHQPLLEDTFGERWLTADSLSMPLDPLWHDLVYHQASRFHDKHYFGTPIPILYDTAQSRVFLRVGGLLFLWFPNNLDSTFDTFMRVPSGLSLREITARLDASNTPFPETLMEPPVYSVPVKELWQWEVEVLGRNRWAELRRRGGEVHSDWLSLSGNRVGYSGDCIPH